MADFNPGAGSLLALRRLTGGMVTPASGPEEMAVPEPAPGPAEMAVPPIGRMPAEPMPPFAPGVPGFVGQQQDGFMSALQQQAGGDFGIEVDPLDSYVGIDPLRGWRELGVPPNMLQFISAAANKSGVTPEEIQARGGDWTEVLPEAEREVISELVKVQRDAEEAQATTEFLQPLPPGVPVTENAIRDQQARNMAAIYGERAPVLGAEGLPRDPLAPEQEKDLLLDRKPVEWRGGLVGKLVGQSGLYPKEWVEPDAPFFLAGKAVTPAQQEHDSLMKEAGKLRQDAYRYRVRVHPASRMPYSDETVDLTLGEYEERRWKTLGPVSGTRVEHADTESILIQANDLENQARHAIAIDEERKLRDSGGNRVELAKQAIESLDYIRDIEEELGPEIAEQYLDERNLTRLEHTMGTMRTPTGQMVLRKMGLETDDIEDIGGTPYFLNDDQYRAVLRGETPLSGDEPLSEQEMAEMRSVAKQTAGVRQLARVLRANAVNGDMKSALIYETLYGFADPDDIELRVEIKPGGVRQLVPRVKKHVAGTVFAPVGPETKEDRKARVDVLRMIKAGRTMLEVHPNPKVRREFIKEMMLEVAPYSPNPYLYNAVQQMQAAAGWDELTVAGDFVAKLAVPFTPMTPIWHLAAKLGMPVEAGDPEGPKASLSWTREPNPEKFLEIVAKPRSYEEARPLIAEFADFLRDKTIAEKIGEELFDVEKDVDTTRVEEWESEFIGTPQDKALREGWETLRKEWDAKRTASVLHASGVLEQRLRRFENWEDTLYETGGQWARENFPDPMGLDSVRRLSHDEEWQTVDGRIIRGVAALDNANAELAATRMQILADTGVLIEAHYDAPMIVTEWLADQMITGEDRYLDKRLKDLPVYKWAMHRTPTNMPIQIGLPLLQALLDIKNETVTAPETDQDKLKSKLVKLLFHANIRAQAPDDKQVKAYVGRVRAIENRVITEDQARKRWMRGRPQWSAMYKQILMEAALPSHERNGWWKEIDISPESQITNLIEFIKHSDVIPFSTHLAVPEDRRWFTRSGRRRIPVTDEVLRNLRPRSLKYLSQRGRRDPKPGRNLFEVLGVPFDATLGPLTTMNIPVSKRVARRLEAGGIVDLTQASVMENLVHGSGAWLQQLDALGDPRYFDFAATINRLPAKDHERMLRISQGAGTDVDFAEFWTEHVPVSFNRTLHGIKMLAKGTFYTGVDLQQWVWGNVFRGIPSKLLGVDPGYENKVVDGRVVQVVKPGVDIKEAMYDYAEPTYAGAWRAQTKAAGQDLRERFGETVPVLMRELIKFYGETYTDASKYKEYWMYDPVPALLDFMTAFQLLGAVKVPLVKATTIDRATLMANRMHRMGRPLTKEQAMLTRQQGYSTTPKHSAPEVGPLKTEPLPKQRQRRQMIPEEEQVTPRGEGTVDYMSRKQLEWVSLRELPQRFVHVIGEAFLDNNHYQHLAGKSVLGPRYGPGIVFAVNTMELLDSNLPVIAPLYRKMAVHMTRHAASGTKRGMVYQYFLNQSSYMSRELKGIIQLGKKEVDLNISRTLRNQMTTIEAMAKASLDVERLPSMREILRDTATASAFDDAVQIPIRQPNPIGLDASIPQRVKLQVRRNRPWRKGGGEKPHKTRRQELADEFAAARAEQGIEVVSEPVRKTPWWEKATEVWVDVEAYARHLDDNWDQWGPVIQSVREGKRVPPNRLRAPMGFLDDPNHAGVFALNLEDLGIVNKKGYATKAFKKLMKGTRNKQHAILKGIMRGLAMKDARVNPIQRLAARVTETNMLQKRNTDGTWSAVSVLQEDVIRLFDSPQVVEQIEKFMHEIATNAKGHADAFMEGGDTPLVLYLRPSQSIVKQGKWDTTVIGDAVYRLNADIVRRPHKKQHAGIRIVSRSGPTEGLHLPVKEGMATPRRLAVSVDAEKVLAYWDITKNPRYLKGSPWHSAIDEPIFKTPGQYLEFSEQIGREMIRNPRGQRSGLAYKREITETVLSRWLKLDTELPPTGAVRDAQGNIIKLDLYDGKVTRQAMRGNEVVGFTLEDLGLVHKQGEHWMPTAQMQYLLEQAKPEMRVLTGNVDTVPGITGAINMLKHMLRDAQEPVFVSRSDLHHYGPSLVAELDPRKPGTGGIMRGERDSGNITAIAMQDSVRALDIHHTIATDNPALIDLLGDLFGDVQVRKTRSIIENRKTHDPVAKPFATQQLDREFYVIYDPDGLPITKERLVGLRDSLDKLRREDPRAARKSDANNRRKKVQQTLRDLDEGIQKVDRPVVVTKKTGLYETQHGLGYFDDPIDTLSKKLADEARAKLKPLDDVAVNKKLELLETRKRKITDRIKQLSDEQAKRAYIHVQRQIEKLEKELGGLRTLEEIGKKNIQINKDIATALNEHAQFEADFALIQERARSAKKAVPERTKSAHESNLASVDERLDVLRGRLEPELGLGERQAKIKGELTWRYEIRDEHLLRVIGDETIDGLQQWYVKAGDEIFPTLGGEIDWLNSLGRKTDNALSALREEHLSGLRNAQAELPLVYGHVMDAVITHFEEGRVFWGYDVRENALGRAAFAATHDTPHLKRVLDSTERIMGQNKDHILNELGVETKFRADMAAGADVSRTINMRRMHKNPMAAVHTAFAALSWEERSAFTYWIRNGDIPPLARDNPRIYQRWMDVGLVDMVNGKPQLSPLGVLSTFFQIDNSTHFYQSALIRGIMRQSQQFSGPAKKFFQVENYLPPRLAYLSDMINSSLSDVQSGMALDWIRHINILGFENAPAATSNALTHWTTVYHGLFNKYLRAADPSDFLEKVIGHAPKIINKTMAERYNQQAASGNVVVDVTPFEAAMLARAELKQNMWRVETVKQMMAEGFIAPGVRDASGKIRAPGNPADWVGLDLSELQGSRPAGPTFVERFGKFGEALDPTIEAKTAEALRKRKKYLQELNNIEHQMLEHNKLQQKYNLQYIFGDLAKASDTYFIRRTQANMLNLTDSVAHGWAQSWKKTQQRFHMAPELRQAYPKEFAALSDVHIPGQLGRGYKWLTEAIAANMIFPVTEATHKLAVWAKDNPIVRNFKVKKLFLSAMGPQTRNVMTNTMLTAELHPDALLPGSTWWKYMKEYMTDYRNGIIKEGTFAEEAATLGIVQSGVSAEIGFKDYTRLSVVIDEWLSGVQKRAAGYSKYLKHSDDAAYVTHLANDIALSHREAMMSTALGEELMKGCVAAYNETTLQAPARNIQHMIWKEVKQAQEAFAPVIGLQPVSPTNRYLTLGKNWFNYTDDSFKYAIAGYLYETKGLRGQALYDAVFDFWPDYNNITKAERMYTLRKPFGVYETKYYQIMTRFMVRNPAYARALIAAHTYLMANELSDPETLQAWKQIPAYKKWQVSNSAGMWVDESMFSVMSNDRLEWKAFQNPIIDIGMTLVGHGSLFAQDPGVGSDGLMYWANMLRTITDVAYGSFQLNPVEAVSNIAIHLGNVGDLPTHWSHTAGDESDWFRDIMRGLAESGGPRMNRLMASIVGEPYPIGANREPYSFLEALTFALVGIQQVKPEPGTFDRAVRMTTGKAGSALRTVQGLLRQANERINNQQLDRAPTFSTKQRLLYRAASRRLEAVKKLEELAAATGLDQPGAQRMLQTAYNLAREGLTTGRIQPGPEWQDKDYVMKEYQRVVQEELDEQIIQRQREFNARYEQFRTQGMRKPWRQERK